MVFSSLFFVFAFFPLCMLLYYAMPSLKLKNAVLLVFSLLFYSWGEPVLVLLMIATVLVNYILGLLIDKTRGKAVSRVFLIISVCCSLGSLVVYKYGDLLIDTVNSITGLKLPPTGLSLPIGISFYTFQVLTYVIDVYRGDAKVQRSPFRLLLYICCFHQLIAGPIVRYEDIAAEISERSVSAEDISCGIRRFITGLGKKAILANMCGEAASALLDNGTEGLSVSGAWFGIIMFSLQIFLDFSAYSDMAIGMGRMCGFHYRENFDYPYISSSVSEFWRRWHISLGSFFRDYVYIPLGGNRRHQLLNLLIVWALTGLWHGASWNFLVWGLYFFVFIALEKFVFGKALKKLPVINNLYTLLVVVVGWVFFYFTDISEAISLLRVMFGLSGNPRSDVLNDITINSNMLLLSLTLICCVPVADIIKGAFGGKKERRISAEGREGLPVVRRAVTAVWYLAVFALSSVMLVGESYNPFLYFRF